MKRTIYSDFTSTAMGSTTPILTQEEIEIIVEEVAGASDDSILSPSEKTRILIPRIYELDAMSANLISSAIAAGVSHTALSTSKTNFHNYLDSLSPDWDDTTQSTNVDRTVLNNLLKAYLDEIANIQGKGVVANNLQELDETAYDALQDIISDGVLSTTEKTNLILEHKRAIAQWTSLDTKAAALTPLFASEKAAAVTAKNNLNSYLAGLTPAWDNPAVNTPIPSPTTFRSTWDSFYSAIAALDAAITAQPGANAKFLAVGSDRQQIAYDGTGTIVAGQSVNFTITAQNLTSSTKRIRLYRMNSAGTLTQLDAGVYLSAGSGVVDNSPDANSFTQTADTFSLTGTNFNSAISGGHLGVIVEVAHVADGLSHRISITKVQNGAAGSSGSSGTSAVTVNLLPETRQVPAYANGNVASYAGISTTMSLLVGTTNVAANFTLSIQDNPQGLTTNISSKTVTVTGASIASGNFGNNLIDTANLTIRATGSGTYAGVVIDKVFTLTKLKGGYEIVSSLPVTDLFVGRQVYLTTDNKIYNYNGSAWVATIDTVSSLDGANITGGSIPAAKLAAGLEVPTTFTGSIPSVKSTNLIINSSTGQAYSWDGSQYRALVDSADTIPFTQITGQVSAARIDGQLTDAQIQGLAAAKLTTQITSSQITDSAISTPKLAAGAVVASKVAANAITTEHLTVASGNLIANGSFETGDLTNWRPWVSVNKIGITTFGAKKYCHFAHSGSGLSIAIFAAVKAYSDVGADQDGFAVEPGKEYRVALTALKSSDAAFTNVTVVAYFAPFATVQASTPIVITPAQLTTSAQKFTGSFVAPAGATRCWLYVIASSMTAGVFYFTDVFCTQKASADLIVDGAVTAVKVAASAITAEKLSVGAMTDNLIVNGKGQEGTSGWTFIGEAGTSFSAATNGWDTTGLTYLQITKGNVSQAARVDSRAFRLVPGRKYSVKFKLSGGSATASGLYVRIFGHTAETVSSTVFTSFLNLLENAPVPAVVSGTGGTDYSFTFTATNTWGCLNIYSYINAPILYFHSVEIREMVDTVRIEDGAVVANKIAANAVSADKIQANAITTGHLKVTGKGAALNADPNCLDLTAWSPAPSNSANVVADPTVIGGSCLEFSATGSTFTKEFIPIEPNKAYDLRIWFKQQSGSSTAYLVVSFYDKAGAQITGQGDSAGWSVGSYAYFGLVGNTPSSTWTEYRVAFGPGEARGIPSNAGFVRVGVLHHYTIGSAGFQRMAGVRLSEMADAAMIVNGSVIASKIQAGAVSAAAIAAGAIRAEHITVGLKGQNLVANPTGAEGTTGAWNNVYGDLGSSALAYYNNWFSGGKPGFQINKPLTSTTSGFGTKAMPVTPGKTYVMRMKTGAGSATGSGMYIRIWHKITYPTSDYVDAGNYDGLTDLVSNGPWAAGPVSHEYTWTCPAGVNWVTLSILNWSGGPTAGYFADVEFFEQSTSVQIGNGAVVADKLAANSVVAGKIATNAIVADNVQAGAITAAKINVTQLSAINANLGVITAGYMQSPSGNTKFDLNNARIEFNNGAYMKVTGVGFGSSNQFLEWYGPTQASLSTCTEANAVYYLKTNGQGYFGGSLSAGVLKNAAQSTATSGVTDVEIGPFGSNGGTRNVVVSFSQLREAQWSGSGGAAPTWTSNGSATFVLERWNGSSWVQLQTQTVSGTTQMINNGDFTWTGTVTFGSSFTFSDNSGGSSIRYRARVSSYTLATFNSGGKSLDNDVILTQNLGIVSTE